MAIILVVDDDQASQVALKTRLKQKGHRVLATGSAVEALVYMHTALRPDLLIIDVHMPFVNGFEFAEKVRHDAALGIGVPILFVSADHRVEVHKAAQRLGGVGLLEKPWRLEDLYNMVEQALAMRPDRRIPSAVLVCH